MAIVALMNALICAKMCTLNGKEILSLKLLNKTQPKTTTEKIQMSCLAPQLFLLNGGEQCIFFFFVCADYIKDMNISKNN